MDVIAACTPDPSSWVGELQWHRETFQESMFRWMPEEAMSLALRWTKGTVEFTTVADMRMLESHIDALKFDASDLDMSMLPLLLEARRRCRPGDWAAGLSGVGLTDLFVEIIHGWATPEQCATTSHHQAPRILKLDLPYRNPFIYVWEMRQLRDLYDEAQYILEDTYYDLLEDLSTTIDWETLASVSTRTTTAQMMRADSAQHMQTRGRAGDARRQPAQRFADAGPAPFGMRPAPAVTAQAR